LTRLILKHILKILNLLLNQTPLYESVYSAKIDKRNFSKRILATGLLIKQGDKDKSGSRRGAYYYQLDVQHYNENFQAFLNLIPNPTHLIF